MIVQPSTLRETRRRERTRCAEIMEAELDDDRRFSRGLRELARYLAFRTDMSAASAVQFLWRARIYPN